MVEEKYVFVICDIEGRLRDLIDHLKVMGCSDYIVRKEADYLKAVIPVHNKGKLAQSLRKNSHYFWILKKIKFKTNQTKLSKFGISV